MQKPKGRFIVFEGGDGAGKSTQAALLMQALSKHKIRVVQTREVGGSKSAEEIRHLWLHKGEDHWEHLTELLLISAARREHLTKTIWPALKEGKWVVSDRFADSTVVYQGKGLGLNLKEIAALYKLVAGKFQPDLTLLLDVPVSAGLARMAKRGGENDRYQRKAKEFHHSLRHDYLALAKKYPKRFVIIDASRDPDSVAAEIEFAVSHHFHLKKKS